MERRQNPHSGESPTAVLKQLPVLVVLERLPTPTLAIAHDGSIVFANTAFAEMVGGSTEEVTSLRFDQVFRSIPATESVLATVHSLANVLVELAHVDGSGVQALMSRSALLRSGDQIALATFQDLTEQLWTNG